MIAPPPPVVSRHSDGDDSDSDWDDDDDFARKINIQIKPIAPVQISASVDELRATVGKWTSMVNLVKPNSRRHQNSTQTNAINNNNNNTNNVFGVLKPAPSVPICITNSEVLATDPIVVAPTPPQPTPPSAISKLPVAFAVQECLNVKMLMSSDGICFTNLIGHIKMAVPRQFAESFALNNGSLDEAATCKTGSDRDNLDIIVSCSRPWDTQNLNEDFLHEKHLSYEDETTNYQINDSCTKLSVDMKAVYDFARQLKNQPPIDCNHILLPELLNYTLTTTRSQQGQPNGEVGGNTNGMFCPPEHSNHST